jgi:hypothetical protein
MNLVEIATNPHGYCLHAVEVLNRYTPDEIQATTTRYRKSNLTVNLEILRSYGSVVGKIHWHSDGVFDQILTVV